MKDSILTQVELEKGLAEINRDADIWLGELAELHVTLQRVNPAHPLLDAYDSLKAMTSDPTLPHYRLGFSNWMNEVKQLLGRS